MARLLGTAALLVCGRVSCHRGRNRLDVKEPFQEETNKDTPSSEEKHKYIFEGTEYDRPPNLFDVGGELKLLPEVLSDLNFDARDFVDDGTAQEQKELRDSRPWGRLHIDGWPAPIQYLRSHVGGPAVDSMRPLVLASPLDACEPLQDANPSGGEGSSAVVIAARGFCTYTTKMRNAERASAGGLLIVNNEEGLLHPPSPDGKGLKIFSGMIPQAEGEALIKVLKNDSVRGVLVPVNCKQNSGIGDKNQQCHPAAKADRELVDSLARGGFVKLPSGERFEYLLAEFGVKVPPRELRIGSSNSSGACTSTDENGGKVILAMRGNCSFIDKAEAAGAGAEAAAALIVVNNETSLFHMGASPRWRGARVSVPTLLVSDVAGRALSALPPGSPIHLTPSKDVKEAAWKEIQQLRQASAWPKENPERHSMYKTLVAGNKGFADRLAALTEAFSRVSGGKDGAGGRSEDRGTPPTEL